MLHVISSVHTSNIWPAIILIAVTVCDKCGSQIDNVTYTILNTCDASFTRVSFLPNSTHLNLDNYQLMKLNRPYCLHAMQLPTTEKEQSCLGNLHTDAFWAHNVLLSVNHLLKDWRSTSAVFITDGFLGIKPISIIKMATRSNILDTNILFLDQNQQNMEQSIKSISSNQKNIVLMCSENITDAVIAYANHSNLLTRPIFWVIVAERIPESLFELGSEIATQVVLLTPSVVIGEDSDRIAIPAKFGTNNYITQCTVAGYHENNSIPNSGNFDILVEMHEIFFSETTQRLESIYFAKWNLYEGLQYRELITNDGGKGRMRGYRMLTISYIDPPHLYFTNNNSTMVGYQLGVAQAVAEYMNFLLDVPLTTEKKTGIELGKGNWIGLVGRVYRREIDFGAAVVGRTKRREQVILYSYPTGEGSMSILFKRPIEEDMKFGAYLQPFTYKVWLAVIAIQALLYAFYLMARFICNSFLPDQQTATRSVFQRENEIWAMASGSVLIEDVISNTFPSASAKVLFGVFLLVLEVCFNYYNSIFTSFLTVYTVKMPFETLEQLMDSGYNVDVVNGTSHHDILKNSDHGIYAEVWGKISSFGERNTPTDKADAMRQVLSRKLAVLVEGPSTQALVHGNCTYMLRKTKHFAESYSMPIRKDLPMKKVFSMSILKLHEHGIKKKLMKYYTPPEMTYCERSNSFVQMGLPHVVSLFILLTFGVTISFVILITEIIVFKFPVNGFASGDNKRVPKNQNSGTEHIEQAIAVNGIFLESH